MRVLLLALLLLSPSAPLPPEFVTIDPVEFPKILASDSALVLISSSFMFIEGPVWNPVTQELILSDINANKMYRWTAAGGVTVFRDPSGRTNGNTLDREGRILSCEQTAQRVSRTALNGTVGTLVGTYLTKKFNAPNDIVVKSDGTIWFTDPDYSSPGATIGSKNVYRYTPSTGDLTAVITPLKEPNGLCFSPDEKKLYVGDSEATTEHKIRVYTVASDNSLDAGTDFKNITSGVPDGMRCDQDGRVFSSAGDGIRIFNPDGTHIGTILTGTTVPANCCFGGADGKTLFITAQTSLYSVHLNTLGTGVASGNPLPSMGGGGGGGGGCGLLGFEAALVLIVLRRRRAASRPASR